MSQPTSASEAPVAAVSVAASNAEDPLQAALHEAECLMKSLGSGSFAIDSDDEDAAAVGNDDSPVDLHPLHENYVHPTASVAQPSSLMGAAAATLQVFSGLAPTPPQQQQQQYMPPDASYGFSSPEAAPSPVWNSNQGHYSSTSSLNHSNIDGLKASTSRFASNLAQMAQRAAHQVTAVATATTPSPTAFPLYPHTGMTPAAVPFSSSLHYSGSSTTASSEPLSQVAPYPPQQPPPQPLPELDAAQKLALVQTHVGHLLPGESIIMFLQNVQHVSDSTGFQYNESATATAIGSTAQWCCAMTFFRIILFSTHPVAPPPRPDEWNAACWPAVGTTGSTSSNLVLQMPLGNMDKVEKSVFTATSHPTGGYGTLAVGTTPSNAGMVPSSSSSTPTVTTLLGLILHDKLNGRQLRFTTTAYPDTNRAYEALQTYAFPGRRNLGYLFAFESKRELVQASVVTDATTGVKQVMVAPVPSRFDAVPEFTRQFTNAAHATLPSMPWSIWTVLNATYQVCPSYPSVLAGPASLDETHEVAARVIRPCAAFRSEQRLPALTWCGVGGSSIWRCSQPKIGLQGNRSSADELYLKHIMERAAAANAIQGTTTTTLPPRSVLVQLTGSADLSNWLIPPNTLVGLKILDLRPRSSAMANRTGGYGYENTSNYPGCTLQFCNIGNIHAVRDAYQKVSQLCLSTVSNDLAFATQVEDTKWLSHLRLIWAAAWETAYWTQVHRLPVLVHCSHGWDRTSQVAALAQLLLDPYYRTCAGFATLMEKDFMSFGHPCHTRCGHGEGRDGAGHSAVTGSGSTLDEGQISPILIQFLDAVYQVVRLYPEAFEFNTKYILLLSEHVYSCRFGNFLCDTEREREVVASLRQRTHAVWDYLEEQRSDTHNMQFDPLVGGGVLLMPLPTLLRNITLWTDRHCMYSPKPTTRWLPQNVEREVHVLNNDQPSDLITEQETQRLLLAERKQASTSALVPVKTVVDEQAVAPPQESIISIPAALDTAL